VQPLLDLNLFNNRIFSLGLVCAVISYICIAAYTLLLPFYFENTLRLTPSVSGLLMMTAPLAIAVLSPVCGTLADRFGPEQLTVAGLLAMGTSFFLMSFFTVHVPLVFCIVCLGIMAAGQSLFLPANNSLVMSACPPE
jgi:MFS family permease